MKCFILGVWDFPDGSEHICVCVMQRGHIRADSILRRLESGRIDWTPTKGLVFTDMHHCEHGWGWQARFQ